MATETKGATNGASVQDILEQAVAFAREFMTELERQASQQPVILELVSRFERLQNKRDSFQSIISKPPLPMVESDNDETASVPVARVKSEPPKKTKPVLTIELALADKKLREHFREFVETAYAVENLDFYEAVESFCKTPSEQLAVKIVDDFIRETSPSQVNLPSALAVKLCSAADNSTRDVETLTALLLQARQEIVRLLQTNFFDKFLSVVGQPAYILAEHPSTIEAEESLDKWVKKSHPKTGDFYFENPSTGVAMWQEPRPISMPPPMDLPPYF